MSRSNCSTLLPIGENALMSQIFISATRKRISRMAKRYMKDTKLQIRRIATLRKGSWLFQVLFLRMRINVWLHCTQFTLKTAPKSTLHLWVLYSWRGSTHPFIFLLSLLYVDKSWHARHTRSLAPLIEVEKTGRGEEPTARGGGMGRMDQKFCFGNVKSAMPKDIQAEMSSRQ